MNTGKNTGTHAAEPYAVLSQNNTVLTFYYDNKREEHSNSMSIGPFYEHDKRWGGCPPKIKTVVFDDTFADCPSIRSTAYWFYECYNLTTIKGIENLKTDNVEDMRKMFRGCSDLTSLDLSGFKTGKVVDMHNMFGGCSGLLSLDLSSFKTGKVEDISEMFRGCSSLTSLYLSSFKTDKVRKMTGMFDGCSSLTSQDLSNFKIGCMKRLRRWLLTKMRLDLSYFKT